MSIYVCSCIGVRYYNSYMSIHHPDTAPIVVVENPNGTRHAEFEDAVLSPLVRAGYVVEVHMTSSPDPAVNIDAMIDQLPY